MITEQQRKYIFVLLRQYGDRYKYTTEEAKEILKIVFCYEENIKEFSLSNCDGEIATKFIDFILQKIEVGRK